jgi:hypothetical protein
VIVCDAGEAESVKFDVTGAVTMRVTVVVRVSPPPVPVMVIV